MDIYEWFQHNCLYAPTKAERKIVRDVIATQYPNDLECIEDHWAERYAYIVHGSCAKFSMITGSRCEIVHSVDEFLGIFCVDDTADEMVDLDSLL